MYSSFPLLVSWVLHTNRSRRTQTNLKFDSKDNIGIVDFGHYFYSKTLILTSLYLMFTFTPVFNFLLLCHTFSKHFPIPTNACRDFNIIILLYYNKVINISVFCLH